MCPGSHALGPQPAQSGSSRLGATAYTAGVVSPLWPAFRPGPLAERRLLARGARPPHLGGGLSAVRPGADRAPITRVAGTPRPGGAATDLAPTVLPLYGPGARRVALAHRG